MIPLGVLASARHQAAAGGFEAVYTGGAAVLGDATTVTQDVPIGAPSPTRTVVIVVAWPSSLIRRVTGIQIGTHATTVDAESSSRGTLHIARATVPTGTTVPVALTLNGTHSINITLDAYAIPGPVEAVSQAVGTVTQSTDLTLASTPDGVVIAGASSANAAVATMTGVTPTPLPADTAAGHGPTPAATHTVTVGYAAEPATDRSHAVAVAYARV